MKRIIFLICCIAMCSITAIAQIQTVQIISPYDGEQNVSLHPEIMLQASGIVNSPSCEMPKSMISDGNDGTIDIISPVFLIPTEYYNRYITEPYKYDMMCIAGSFNAVGNTINISIDPDIELDYNTSYTIYIKGLLIEGCDVNGLDVVFEDCFTTMKRLPYAKRFNPASGSNIGCSDDISIELSDTIDINITPLSSFITMYTRTGMKKDTVTYTMIDSVQISDSSFVPINYTTTPGYQSEYESYTDFSLSWDDVNDIITVSPNDGWATNETYAVQFNYGPITGDFDKNQTGHFTITDKRKVEISFDDYHGGTLDSIVEQSLNNSVHSTSLYFKDGCPVKIWAPQEIEGYSFIEWEAPGSAIYDGFQSNWIIENSVDCSFPEELIAKYAPVLLDTIAVSFAQDSLLDTVIVHGAYADLGNGRFLVERLKDHALEILPIYKDGWVFNKWDIISGDIGIQIDTLSQRLIVPTFPIYIPELPIYDPSEPVCIVFLGDPPLSAPKDPCSEKKIIIQFKKPGSMTFQEFQDYLTIEGLNGATFAWTETPTATGAYVLTIITDPSLSDFSFSIDKTGFVDPFEFVDMTIYGDYPQGTILWTPVKNDPTDTERVTSDEITVDYTKTTDCDIRMSFEMEYNFNYVDVWTVLGATSMGVFPGSEAEPYEAHKAKYFECCLNSDDKSIGGRIEKKYYYSGTDAAGNTIVVSEDDLGAITNEEIVGLREKYKYYRGGTASHYVAHPSVNVFTHTNWLLTLDIDFDQQNLIACHSEPAKEESGDAGDGDSRNVGFNSQYCEKRFIVSEDVIIAHRFRTKKFILESIQFENGASTDKMEFAAPGSGITDLPPMDQGEVNAFVFPLNTDIQLRKDLAQGTNGPSLLTDPSRYNADIINTEGDINGYKEYTGMEFMDLYEAESNEELRKQLLAEKMATSIDAYSCRAIYHRHTTSIIFNFNQPVDITTIGIENGMINMGVLELPNDRDGIDISKLRPDGQSLGLYVPTEENSTFTVVPETDGKSIKMTLHVSFNGDYDVDNYVGFDMVLHPMCDRWISNFQQIGFVFTENIESIYGDKLGNAFYTEEYSENDGTPLFDKNKSKRWADTQFESEAPNLEVWLHALHVTNAWDISNNRYTLWAYDWLKDIATTFSVIRNEDAGHKGVLQGSNTLTDPAAEENTYVAPERKEFTGYYPRINNNQPLYHINGSAFKSNKAMSCNSSVHLGIDSKDNTIWTSSATAKNALKAVFEIGGTALVSTFAPGLALSTLGSMNYSGWLDGLTYAETSDPKTTQKLAQEKLAEFGKSTTDKIQKATMEKVLSESFWDASGGGWGARTIFGLSVIGHVDAQYLPIRTKKLTMGNGKIELENEVGYIYGTDPRYPWGIMRTALWDNDKSSDISYYIFWISKSGTL